MSESHQQQPEERQPAAGKRPYQPPAIELLGHMGERTQACGGTRLLDAALPRQPRRQSQPILGAP
ncbi:MAG: hypothetical protein AB7K24_07065 [Gemmataceae bacterium]